MRRDGQEPTRFAGDVRDDRFIESVIRAVAPTHVVHLAAILPGSDQTFEDMYEINVSATERLVDAVARLQPGARVLISSSSGVYGSPEIQPISEDSPLSPVGIYAETKAQQERAALDASAGRCRVVIARMFNLLGPGQAPRMLVPVIARQIAAAERGGLRVLRLGELGPERDYVDVRDAADGIACLLFAEDTDEVYNVCSGVARSGRECLDLLLGLSRVELSVENDEARLRPDEIQTQRGDFTRLSKLASWEPGISFTDSVSDVLEDWRGRAAL
jgi:GDP-4-dehydro-6-deoxy-D-mannose reductase